MANKSVTIIDETLREGMQYQGLMFSKEQRIRILDFQEALGTDVCQAGYPIAHEKETGLIKTLVSRARDKGYKIRICAMGRALKPDVKAILATGVTDLHLHQRIDPGLSKPELKKALERLLPIRDYIHEKQPAASICIIMLDIGRSDPETLEQCVTFCAENDIDMISLPDTSGIMVPDQVHALLSRLRPLAGQTQISIHCHNDMGFANANSYMGVAAGGNVLEASVLGIGERNGIADLYTTAETLKQQGYGIRLNTDDRQTFEAYYRYVDTIVYDQLGHHLLTVNTPFFGGAVQTHVAGTHADGQFGMSGKETYYLNGLCGRGLVQRFLDAHRLFCPTSLLNALTREIKSQSYALNRRLTPDEVKKIIVLLANSG